MRSLLRLVVFSFQFLVFGFALATAAAAQTVDVTGTVKDASGAVLPGATIDASVAGLSVATTITGPDGRYQIALAPNTSVVTASRSTVRPIPPLPCSAAR